MHREVMIDHLTVAWTRHIFSTGEIFMKKFALLVVLMVFGSSAFAGECATGNCTLRSRVVNVTKEVISVPVTVTRRTVEATRNVGRRTVARVRSVVR
jgi:hypothetical protein